MTTTKLPSIDKPVEQQGSLIEYRGTFKVLEYIALDAFLATIVLTLFFRNNQLLITLDAAFLASFVFLSLFNRQYFSFHDQIKKTKKYEKLLEESSGTENRIKLEKENALRYCQQLVEDYTQTRRNARNAYYFFQIATIIFSGVTPVLVLVDKLDIGIEWIKWLPVIFPALASILASVVTSFPLETIWKSANTVVENLEAEQEKFLLGISDNTILNMPGDIAQNKHEEEQTYEEKQKANKEAKQLETKAKRVIVNFVNKVNEIHLNQLRTSTQAIEEQEQEQEQNPEEESA